MENEKLGQEPAFPNENTAFCQPPDCYGLSKRFYAACAAMQGILSNQKWVESMEIADDWDEFKERVISGAYELADELLKQEKL